MRYLDPVSRAFRYIVRTGVLWCLTWAAAGIAVYGFLVLASMFFVATGSPPLALAGDTPGSIVLGAFLGAFYGGFAGLLFGLLSGPLLLVRRLRHRSVIGGALGALAGLAIAVASANGMRSENGAWPSDLSSALAAAAVLGCIAGAFTVRGRSHSPLREGGQWGTKA